MISLLERLNGEARRQLLLVATLYFGILFLESSVGHIPVLSAGWMNPALLPVIVLPLSLLALMAAFIKPSVATERILQIAMILALIVGVIGVFPHLAANGVTLQKLGPVFNGSVFHGDPGPTWPLAICFGALLGLAGSFGLATDQPFARAVRVGPIRWLDKIAFAFLLAGIALSPSIATLGWGCTVTVIGCILLLANVLAGLTSLARTRRDAA